MDSIENEITAEKMKNATFHFLVNLAESFDFIDIRDLCRDILSDHFDVIVTFVHDIDKSLTRCITPHNELMSVSGDNKSINILFMTTLLIMVC